MFHMWWTVLYLSTAMLIFQSALFAKNCKKCVLHEKSTPFLLMLQAQSTEIILEVRKLELFLFYHVRTTLTLNGLGNRLKMDIRRLESAHIWYAMLRVAQWYLDDIDTAKIIFTIILLQLYWSLHWSSRNCIKGYTQVCQYITQYCVAHSKLYAQAFNCKRWLSIFIVPATITISLPKSWYEVAKHYYANLHCKNRTM